MLKLKCCVYLAYLNFHIDAVKVIWIFELMLCMVVLCISHSYILVFHLIMYFYPHAF